MVKGFPTLQRKLNKAANFNRRKNIRLVNWNNATWQIDGSGRAYNTPTLGGELLTNPSFEIGFTSGLATGWLKALGSEIVAQETTIIQDGSNSQRVETLASSAGIYQYKNSSMLSGRWYLSSVWANGNGLIRITIQGNNSAQKVINGNSAWQQNICSYRYSSGNSGIYVYAGSPASNVFYVDNATIKEVSLPTTLAIITGNNNSLTVADKIHTIITGTQIGVASLIDSSSNPQNFIIAYHDGTNVRLEKCVAGVYTQLISTAVTFVSNAQIEIRRPSGNTFQLWYNGVQINTDQTVSDSEIINNTLYGMFSTYSGNLISEFTLGGVVIPFTF